ncbi:MAG: hypothetical protein HY258_13815 [Chloroflexi bacterium]|nr:hypothetical protein [Chloroflexota bacterium]
MGRGRSRSKGERVGDERAKVIPWNLGAQVWRNPNVPAAFISGVRKIKSCLGIVAMTFYIALVPLGYFHPFVPPV